MTAISPGDRLDPLPGEIRRVRAGLLDDDAESRLPQLIAGIETDKANMIFEADAAGTLIEITHARATRCRSAR